MPFSLGLSLFDDKILWLNEQLSNESEDVFALSVLMADWVISQYASDWWRFLLRFQMNGVDQACETNDERVEWIHFNKRKRSDSFEFLDRFYFCSLTSEVVSVHVFTTRCIKKKQVKN